MKLTKAWLWGVRFADGTYLHLEGDTIEEAAASVGSSFSDVRRYMPLKSKKVEEAKALSLQTFLAKRKDGHGDESSN